MKDKFVIICLISLLGLSVYLIWGYNVLYNSYKEMCELHENKYHETIYDLTLLMPEGLDQHYERIRMHEREKFSRKGYPGWLLFYVTQVLHDLGNYAYGHHSTEFNKTVGTECKNLTMNFAFDFLKYVNRSYPNINRMHRVYNWVNYFIFYVNDTNEFGRFPIETLIYRFGDCEDQAMALSFLLESLGYGTALCLIHDKNLTEYGSEGLYHTFCAVRKSDFEYNGILIQLHRYAEYGNNWIVLDAAFNHLFGEDPEWMEYYRKENGTVYITQTIWESLLVDSIEVITRAEKIGITLDG